MNAKQAAEAISGQPVKVGTCACGQRGVKKIGNEWVCQTCCNRDHASSHYRSRIAASSRVQRGYAPAHCYAAAARQAFGSHLG